MQAGESIRRSLLYHLFRNGELVGTSGKQGGWFARVPPPHLLGCLLFQVQVQPTVLTGRTLPPGLCLLWNLSSHHPPSLPSSPWSQPSGRFLSVHIDLCTGLCVACGALFISFLWGILSPALGPSHRPAPRGLSWAVSGRVPAFAQTPCGQRV